MYAENRKMCSMKFANLLLHVLSTSSTMHSCFKTLLKLHSLLFHKSTTIVHLATPVQTGQLLVATFSQ